VISRPLGDASPKGWFPDAEVPYMLAACETKESGKQWFGKEFTGVDDA